jgi:hypothetical protein
MIEKINSKEDITHSMSPLRMKLSIELFDKLHGVMNEIHGTGFSKRFWMILLGESVNSAISRINVLEKGDIRRKPDLYPFNKRSLPNQKEKFKEGVFLFAKHLKSRKSRGEIPRLMNEENILRIGFPEYDGMDNEGIGVNLPLYYPFITGRGDRGKRETANEIAERFPDPFMRNVVRELPTVVVEHFSKLYNGVELYEPEKKEFHVHIAFTWHTLYMLARYSEHGARITWYQHGSYYGEFAGDSAHYHEHEISDEYRTWGWKIREKDTPWKAYRLEKFRREYDKHPNRKECSLLVAFSKISTGNRKSSQNLTEYLLEHLDPVKYRKIMARPQPANKVFNQTSQLNFIDNERVVKSTGLTHMAEDMSKCRLVLQMRVPATNFLECIYVNHPTIGLLRNDQPTEILKPYYKFFIDNGVLHHNFKSLVKHLNRVDVDQWWSGLTEEPLFREYRDTFTRQV